MENLILLLACTVAAISDYRTNEIPVWLFPSTAVIHTVIAIINNSDLNYLDKGIAATLAFITFILMAMFFNGGGGDIIMMSSLGWCIGTFGIIIIVLFSSFVCLLHSFYMQKKYKTKDIPYAPYVLLALTIYFII